MVIALTVLSTSGCDLTKNQLQHDRAANKELQDYRDMLNPRPIPKDKEEDLPDFQPMISTPPDLKLPSPLVTVSVNRTVSLRDLMFELTNQAGVDIEMDPQIRGSIIFTAKDRPFNEVVQRICDMTGIRYRFENNVLRVELDRPYVKNYKMDYMGMSRTSSSSINNSVTVSGEGSSSGSSSSSSSSSSGSTSSGVSSSSGSSSSISGSYNSTFWADLNSGLEQILTASNQNIALATLADPVSVTVAPAQPQPTAENPNPAPNLSPPTINVNNAAAEALTPNPVATYSISQETGIITVFATERQHRIVKKYLDDFRRNSMAQIEIQAKILEVSLKDEYATGIDWGSIKFFSTDGTSSDAGMSINMPYSGTGTGTFTANISLARFFQPVVQALSQYGTVRALSSPRVTVMNSRPAVVNMTRNVVYFTIEREQSVSSSSGSSGDVVVETVNSTPNTAAEGVLLNVLPTANVDTGEIILSIRPTVSNITDSIEDPVNEGNTIPEMSVQEIDSIVKVQSGQTVVMGGIMRDNSTASQSGVPILGDVPVIGNLFSSHTDKIQKNELVILLQATLVPGSNAHDTDRELYREFGLDRHPVKF